MKFGEFSLAAWSMVSLALPAIASAAEPAPLVATPIGSPADWLAPQDYPAVALRYDMAGVTAFALTVDTSGKPSRCDIVKSSGFDALDRATCERLMANAKFTPPHDRKGKLVESTYRNSVRWVMPDGEQMPLSESFGAAVLTVDQSGKMTSCKMVMQLTAGTAPPSENSCGNDVRPSEAAALEILGNHAAASNEVQLQQALAFSPDLRTRALAPVAGYEQRALNVYRFTVTKDGKVAQCSYVEQRGIDNFAADFCGQVRERTFDPPFSAYSKDGVAEGWHVERILLKTGG